MYGKRSAQAQGEYNAHHRIFMLEANFAYILKKGLNVLQKRLP
jgi:hypothetical protein